MKKKTQLERSPAPMKRARTPFPPHQLPKQQQQRNDNKNALWRQPQAAERVDHLADEVTAAAVEQGRVPHDHVPHVNELRQRVALLIHDLLGPLDGLHELLYSQPTAQTNCHGLVYCYNRRLYIEALRNIAAVKNATL